MGSVEAILDVLDSYESDQCRLHLLSYGVGAITEHDINMAASFKGKYSKQTRRLYVQLI